MSNPSMNKKFNGWPADPQFPWEREILRVSGMGRANEIERILNLAIEFYKVHDWDLEILLEEKLKLKRFEEE